MGKLKKIHNGGLMIKSILSTLKRLLKRKSKRLNVIDFTLLNEKK